MLKKIFVTVVFTALILFGSTAEKVSAQDVWVGTSPATGWQCYVMTETNAEKFNFLPLTTDTSYTGMVDPYIDFLSLRSGPSVYYSEILRIPPGAYVTVRYDSMRDGGTGFAFVKYNGVTGYACLKYIIRV